ncbi:hypothetical protein RND81_07G135900 [Saponaria officinalis]|uniref:Uncharacterized protein n=1 Tax=Saponaria officinalis TaxID=3572 RepID=A0AAW1JQ29_SAPOF
MSKKKTFSGNTMTLKDFHGGSIPSDLPLPSAPGVIVRSTNDHRQGYDRQTTSWGNPANRSSDHRLRPGSSGSMRSSNLSLDDKSMFLSSSVNIGRNFDEDERKPLDGGPSVPRRMVSDDVIRSPGVRTEVRGEVGRVGVGRESSGLGLGLGSGGNSYSARVVEGGNVGAVSVGVRPNAWGVKKDVGGFGVGVNETVSTMSGGGQSTVSKFAQASALDQISSGRWQTKPLHQHADVEVIRQSDSPSSLYARESEYFGGGGGVGLVSEKEYVDTALMKHAEWGLTIEEGVRRNFREVPGVDRVRSPDVFDGKDRSPVLFTNNGQLVCPDGRYDNSESLMPPEEKMPAKPKLKLLPRTKPLSVPEPSIVDYKQPINASHSETGAKSHGNGRHVKPGLATSEVNHVKPGLSGSEAPNQVVERPKLNLKPRSQPLDQSEDNTERKRIPLFGGARPRETVLKERGVDDVVNSHDEAQGPSRTRNDSPRTEVAPTHKSTVRHAERVPNPSIDQRAGRGLEKKDKRPDIQKADTQRDNWRNENWRSIKDTEKQPQQERPTSPETWRKPIQPSKVGDADNSLRFGKAVSAVELAQAFSRPASDPSPFSGQRGLPGRTQIPFSRLTSSTTRPQLNGF